MGTNQSNLSENENTSISAKMSSRHGFQILRVHPNSPVSEAKVFPYFDFITAVNGVEVVNQIINHEIKNKLIIFINVHSPQIFPILLVKWPGITIINH